MISKICFPSEAMLNYLAGQPGFQAQQCYWNQKKSCSFLQKDLKVSHRRLLSKIQSLNNSDNEQVKETSHENSDTPRVIAVLHSCRKEMTIPDLDFI